VRRLFLSIFILATSVQAAPEGSNDLQAGAAAINPAFLKLGHQQFIVCSACHGQAGEGTGAGPPLAGSEWVSGPVENLIRIQLRGLQGPIKVKGVEYNFPAGMAALAYQTDEQIAAVLTYVRNSHGNSASAVSPAEVAAFRGEVGKPALTVADLISPFPATADPVKAISNKYDGLPARNSSNLWMIVLLVAAVAIIAFFIFKKKST
jgi:mono/diheme cytochrome c family protein